MLAAAIISTHPAHSEGHTRGASSYVSLVAACCCYVSSSASSDTLKIYYENRPPFMVIENGELAGTEGSPAREALRAAHVDYELVEAPVVRQVALVASNTGPGCAVGLYRTPEREKLGKYTQPIFQSQTQDVVIRADNQALQNVTSLSGLLNTPSIRLVLRNGYSYGAALDAMLLHATAVIMRPPEDSAGRIRLVQMHLADAALFTADEASYLLRQMGNDGKPLVIRKFSDSPPGQPRHIFCSNSVDNGIIKRLDEVLNPKP